MRSIFLQDLYYGSLTESSIKPIFLFAGNEMKLKIKEEKKQRMKNE